MSTTEIEAAFRIIPPDDLVRDWARFQNHEDSEALWRRIATLAARWGRTQLLKEFLIAAELEAQ